MTTTAAVASVLLGDAPGGTAWDEGTVTAAVARAGSAGFRRWEAQVRGCGYCARPVRLHGHVEHQAPDGRRERVYDTREEPDRVLLVRCGNRRAAVCPSCSREYKGDMWHLLHAGVAGGSKGIPAEVAARPLVFATLTAPSFGPVHTTRRDRAGGPARGRPRRDKQRAVCEHGRPSWCMAVHAEGDPALGEALCPGCYDYAAAVWFNVSAPELWRRFTTYLPRVLARLVGLSERRLREAVRVQYAKVAEFQRRGVVHFHAVIRLDGPGSDYPAPGLDMPVETLAAAVVEAAALVSLRVPAWTEGRAGVVLRFGAQVDARPVRHGDGLTEGAVTPGKVAGYIAKYATKAAEDFGLPGRISRPADLDHAGQGVSAHVRAMVQAAHDLAPHEPRLGRWLHMLGFPGHFATKSRAFSTTLGAIRGERAAHRRRQARGQGPVDELDQGEGEDATTLVVGSWRFAGLGYTTTGDAAMAASAAARAREYAEEARLARAAATG